MTSENGKPAATGLLALAALGVVYGDIGTSPLYALREAFGGSEPFAITQGNVLGVLSLVLWALVLVVTVKYLVVILRADNKGEGGVLALMALATNASKSSKRMRRVLLMLGIFGAALLYGDGIITPAISVLSAVEGISLAAPQFSSLIIPITVGILVGLFFIQKRGTGAVGRVFGPITFVWFAAMALLGIRGIVTDPSVLAALNPLHAVKFFIENGPRGILILGGVFLVCTGGEALYADMGHFGKRPIRHAWFAIVLPALLLNYFGQGALLLHHPEALENPFYLLAPAWALVPLIILATAATIIASQALISGAFSLTMQAVQLDLLPRLKIQHTSSEERGQVYMPQVNWAIATGAIVLVLSFGSSARLAGAYGIAVACTMAVSTMMFYPVAVHHFHWRRPVAALVAGGFLAIDLAFIAANGYKIADGGWVPLALAVAIYVVMTTWVKGRSVARRLLAPRRLPLAPFLDELDAKKIVRVPGTAIFPVSHTDEVPRALLRNLEHNKILHDHVTLIRVSTDEIAHVDAAQRVSVTPLRSGFTLVEARYGFREEPDVPAALAHARSAGLKDTPDDLTYFLERERFIATRLPSGMAFWREHLFAILAKNSDPPAQGYRIPAERAVEIAGQVRLELPELIAKQQEDAAARASGEAAPARG